MNREQEQHADDLIDLGVASEETKGAVNPLNDTHGGIGMGGITNE